jgi:hypothetical protein
MPLVASSDMGTSLPSTGDVPPAAGVMLTFPAETPDNTDRFQDNYHMLEGENEDTYTFGEKVLHYLGGHICQQHWTAIKAAIVFKAGTTVSKLPPMSKSAKEAKILSIYHDIVNELNPIVFSNDLKTFLAGSFRAKDKEMQGDHLYRYYLDSRCKMRSQIIQHLPANFVSMRSGKGFHDTCNDVMLKLYRKELVQRLTHTQDEADQELLPEYFEFRKSPWFYLLTVKIFRTDPNLAPVVADILDDANNATESRASLKRKAQIAKHKELFAKETAMNPPPFSIKLEKAVDPSSSSSVNSSVTTANCRSYYVGDNKARRKAQKGDIWAKVRVAKAMEQTSNVGIRMAKIEELEKTLNLLDRIRPTIGESAYEKKVQSLLGALPNPESFSKDVEVIVLHDSSDDDCAKNSNPSGNCDQSEDDDSTD